MGTLDLTVQVTNISPKTTKTDLLIFFSYCGTVDEIQLQREGDQSQLATVTFSQPYALKTALLLNGASIGDRRVRVLPLENITDIPVESSESEFDNMSTKGDREAGYSPASTFNNLAQASSIKGQELVSKVRDLVSDTRRIMVQQTNSAISAATNGGFSKGTAWLTDVLDRASKKK
ncbi:uncharacterized protein [Typha angustifolia]|uniref:uncharacterized protein isoform X1 n=1 Tax=Typha angustifolia TaxID=59011 RepID=UPI003C2BD595